MNDKKILAILTPETDDAVISTFITSYARGKNIDVTLCTVRDDVHMQTDAIAHRRVAGGVRQAVTLTCTRQHIPLRIAELHADATTAMRKRAAFADLVLVDKDVLRTLALRDELPQNSAAIVALPKEFNAFSNIILLFDGSDTALRGIKEFFQAFSSYTRHLDVTLLRIEVPNYEFDRDKEVMLVEYLRQYSENIGVLNVQPPLSDRHLRAIPQSTAPIAIGTLEYLIGQHGDNTEFKPFYDNHSTLFIPATNS